MPAVSEVSGQPVCQECLDHYMGIDSEFVADCREEYITADKAVDLRGF